MIFGCFVVHEKSHMDDVRADGYYMHRYWWIAAQLNKLNFIPLGILNIEPGSSVIAVDEFRVHFLAMRDEVSA